MVKTTGVFRPGPFVETTEDTFHWHYNINVLGPVLTTLEAIKYFGDKGGSIINISSIVGSHPPADDRDLFVHQKRGGEPDARAGFGARRQKHSCERHRSGTHGDGRHVGQTSSKATRLKESSSGTGFTS